MSCPMARRARALGLSLVLAIHYSDSWADPGHQAKPAAWLHLSSEELRDSVRVYTYETLTALKAHGVTQDIVQIGNEITTGLLWDDGRVGGAFDTEDQWSALAALLQSGIDGVRAAVGGASKVMIHIDRGGSAEGARWFFDGLRRHAVPFDMIGLSYYPWWHGSLANLEETLALLADRFSKPFFLAETAYPWTLEWFDDRNNIVGLPEHVLPGFPATSRGQADFVSSVVKLMKDTSLGAGACYWAPDYVAAPNYGSPWENLALFDEMGEVLPAAAALGGAWITRREIPPDPPPWALYPNPARHEVRIQYYSIARECARVEIFDALGRLVQDISGGCAVGARVITASTSGLAPGVYTVILYGGRDRTATPLVITQ